VSSADLSRLVFIGRCWIRPSLRAIRGFAKFEVINKRPEADGADRHRPLQWSEPIIQPVRRGEPAVDLFDLDGKAAHTMFEAEAATRPEHDH
jgi:hypothetical protein